MLLCKITLPPPPSPCQFWQHIRVSLPIKTEREIQVNPAQLNIHSLWSTRDFSHHRLKASFSYYTPKESRGLVAAQLSARTSGCSHRSGSPIGARFPACCVRVAVISGHGLTSWLTYLQKACVAAATSLSPSALPQHLDLSSFKEKINPSLRTRGPITKPSWPPQSIGI